MLQRARGAGSKVRGGLGWGEMGGVGKGVWEAVRGWVEGSRVTGNRVWVECGVYRGWGCGGKGRVFEGVARPSVERWKVRAERYEGYR